MQISDNHCHDQVAHKFLRRSNRVWALVLAIGLSPLARADLVVPASSVLNVGGGTIDLACTDLVVAGTLQLGAGSIINIRHLSIQAGGVIGGGSGVLSLGGNWMNAGAFLAGTGAVLFRDLCSLTAATVTGDSTFSTASFVSAVGKNYVFGVGSTQTVLNVLEIAGTAAKPIQFRTATAGQVGNVKLLPGGTQQIQHVGVTDVWATGQQLAPKLTNEGGGGNARGWFGASATSTVPVPALADGALAALAVALAALAGAVLRRRERLTAGAIGRDRC